MEQPQPKPVGPWASRLVILGLIGLVALPIVFYGCRDETVNWQMALLAEQYENGSKLSSTNLATELFKNNPANVNVGKLLAQWHLDNHQPERALEICKSLAKNNADNFLLVELHIRALCHLGRYEEALQLMKDRNQRFSFFSRPENIVTVLNGLAYLRALADMEIDQAEDDIEDVLSDYEKQKQSDFGFVMPIGYRIHLLSAIVFVEAQEYDQARRALETVIEQIETRWLAISGQNTGARITTKIHPIHATPQSPAEQKALAMFRACLAKVYQETGATSQREQLIQSVLDAGFDPQQLLNELPSGKLAGREVGGIIGPVDTRACVRFRKAKIREALHDANAVVIGARAYIEAIEKYKYYQLTSELTDESEYIKYFDVEPKRTLACLLYHRSWILEAMIQNELAEKDLAEIRQLGYEPVDELNF